MPLKSAREFRTDCKGMYDPLDHPWMSTLVDYLMTEYAEYYHTWVDFYNKKNYGADKQHEKTTD
jgi:hypothetical protein